MTTPILTPQQKNQQILQGSPQALTWLISDAAGAPKNISSGYVADAEQQFSSQVDAAGSAALPGTFTYGSDGVLTLTLSQSQANTVHTGTWPYFVTLSNDSGTTVSVGARGTLIVVGLETT